MRVAASLVARAAGAARLLAEKGPAGASLGDVLAATGSPRGSTYHHFPGGKREMYAEALDLASDRARRYLEACRGQPPAVVVERFFEMWRELLDRTDLRVGCAVLAVAVAGVDEATIEHAGSVFRSWRSHLASLLADGGMDAASAETLAATTIAAAEGAVAIARAERSMQAFDLVAAALISVAAQ
jgi:AcrR family transcriptional regulator